MGEDSRLRLSTGTGASGLFGVSDNASECRYSSSMPLGVSSMQCAGGSLSEQERTHRDTSPQAHIVSPFPPLPP